MAAGLAQGVQADFAAGIFPAVARELIPSNGLRDLTNGLLDLDGHLYKRGGPTFASAAFGSAGINAMWDGFLTGGQRTVLAASTGLAALDADNSTVIALGGAGINSPLRPVGLVGLMFAGSTMYAGARKAPYSAGTVALTAGSKTATGAGTAWLANVDAGMLMQVGGSGRYYVVASVQSDTSLTLTDAAETNYAAGAYAMTRVGSLTAAPYQSGPLVTVAGRRLVIGSADSARFSGRGNPHSFAATDFHRVPDGANLLGLYGLRDDLYLFSTRGLYIATQMTLDLVDPSGSPQQTLSLANGELVLWGDAGLAGWDQALVVPALDHVWLLRSGQGAEPLTRSCWTLLRDYIRAGHRPGQAAVYLNHYFLPVVDALGQVVDTLVCRLDRPTRTPQGVVYPWSRLDGNGANVRCYARRVSTAGAPDLLGGQVNSSRALDCSGYFEPATAPTSDPDGSRISFEVISRDVPTGQLNENLLRRLRVAYQLDDPGESVPVVTGLTFEQQPYQRTGGSHAGAFNTPLPPNAALDAASAQMSADLAADNAATRPRMTSDSSPVFIAQSSDPVWTINATGSGGSTTIRAPQALAGVTGWGPDNTVDKPLELFDNATSPGTYKEVRCWQTTSIDGVNHVVTCVNLGVTSYGPSSDVIPWAQGYGTGCGLPIAAGLLRIADFQAGEINHAIRVAGPSYIKNTHRLPADSSDQSGDGHRGAGSGALEMGVRLRLKASVNPATRTCWNPTGQSLTPTQAANRNAWLQMICRALQRYGMIVSDGAEAGQDAWGFQMELDSIYGGTADWQSVFGPNDFGNPYWSWMLRGLTTEGYTGSSSTDGIPWDQFEVVADGAPPVTSSQPPTLTAYFSDGRPPAVHPAFWGQVEWGAFDWGDPGGAQWTSLSNDAPPDDGRHPWSWRINRRCRFGRFRLLSSDPTTKLVVKSMETFTRQAGKR